MFRNLKVRYRILLGSAIPLVLFVIVALVVASNISAYGTAHWQTQQSIDTFSQSQAVFLSEANLQTAMRGYLLLKNDESLKYYSAFKARLDTEIKSLALFIRDSKQRELFSRIGEMFNLAISLNDEIVLLVQNGKVAEAMDRFRTSSILTLVTEGNTLSDEFNRNETALLLKAQTEEKATLVSIGDALLWGMVLSSILSVFIAMVIARGITKRISGAINGITSAATQIAATANQHERMATQQASMVNETATTMKELSISSQQTSDQASLATESTQKSLVATEEGSELATRVADGMESLGAKVGVVAVLVVDLGEKSAQIGTLANIIKDLSGEINMLALNAAVEAARAGEHGKGFAVVAREVRKQANESKKSAEQANQIVAVIRKATDETILRTDEETKVVESVTLMARGVGDLFSSLSNSASTTYENAQQVLLNARQQAIAISQVLEAVNILNAGAVETSIGLTQTKTGIEQLKTTAANLNLFL